MDVFTKKILLEIKEKSIYDIYVHRLHVEIKLVEKHERSKNCHHPRRIDMQRVRLISFRGLIHCRIELFFSFVSQQRQLGF